MTRDEARAVLNRAKDGQPVKAALLRQALTASGDLAPVQRRSPAGTWERSNASGLLAPALWFDPMR